jgi:hypothetical protein
MEFLNLPELMDMLTDYGNKVVRIGGDLVADLSGEEIGGCEEELKKFYKLQINLLLANNVEREKSIVLFPKNNPIPHSYISPLLHIITQGS